MNNKIKYPKVIGAVLVSSFLLYFVFSLTFSKTLELRDDIDQLSNEITEFEIKRSSMDTLSSSFGINEMGDLGSKNLQEEIVQIINLNNRKNCKLNKMFELKEVSGDGIKVQIQPVLLEGRFFDMLSTLHFIEKEMVHLHVPSVEMYKERNRKTKRNEFYMKIYVQKII